jgi:hypothetical protein
MLALWWYMEPQVTELLTAVQQHGLQHNLKTVKESLIVHQSSCSHSLKSRDMLPFFLTQILTMNSQLTSAAPLHRDLYVLACCYGCYVQQLLHRLQQHLPMLCSASP